MTFPTVTEITPRLEAVTPDPFIVALSRSAALLRKRQARLDDRAGARRALDP
jgi:hypothetical protein